MQTVMVLTAAAPVIGAVISAAGARLRGRRLSHRHLRTLPPGSRVIDLGGAGLIVEIGGRPSPAADDE